MGGIQFKVAALLAVKGIKRSKMIKDLSLSATTMSRFFSGKGSVSSETLVLILNYLDIDITGILSQEINKASIPNAYDKDSERDRLIVNKLINLVDKTDRKIIIKNLKRSSNVV